ncbi:hypothetical protein [Methylobacterium sp. Leaf118]|uniref:hypothetical protein n=1 Tax=Methylobacterium sp. Leaf118 TaxID=2876562 RepID=UPI001E4C4823|nr:hypothetical protein [Methylobacterium sp. Leaf118]
MSAPVMPCLSLGETNDALRSAAEALDTARYHMDRVLAGAREGSCSIRQALWATDLRNEALSFAGSAGAVEAAVQHAMEHQTTRTQEAA